MRIERASVGFPCFSGHPASGRLDMRGDGDDAEEGQLLAGVQVAGHPLGQGGRSIDGRDCPKPGRANFDWVREHDKEREEENGRKSRTNGEVLRLKRELERVKKERDFLKRLLG